MLAAAPDSPTRCRLLAGSLVAAILLAYSNSFDVPFQFDDFDVIASNRSVRTLLLPAEDRNHKFDTRPVGRWSLWLNYSLHRYEVFGYHVLNVGIHIAATLTLFGLIRRTLRPKVVGTLRVPSAVVDRASKLDGTRSVPTTFEHADWLAFAIALLWCLHPLQTQAVTYIIQRLESLMALFFLLTLYCLARGSQSPRSWLWNLGAVVSCGLSIGSKEVGAMIPLVALAYDYTFLPGTWRERLRARGLVYVGFLAAALWFSITLSNKFADGMDISHGVTAWQYFRSQPGVIWHYLRLTFWPDVLVLDYAWPVANRWQEIVPQGLALTALLVASFAGCWRRQAWGFLGLASFLILAPTSSFMPIIDLAFEHRMYLPLAAISVLVVFAVWVLIERLGTSQPVGRRLGLAIVAVVAVALGARTYARNNDWREPYRLWSENARLVPHSYRAWANLAVQQMDRGKVELALVNGRRAVAIKPSYRLLQLHGSLLMRAKRPGEALGEYRRAVEMKPDYARGLLGMAEAYEKLGQIDQADEYYRRGLEEDPEIASVRERYARMLASLGRHDEANLHFALACQHQPDAALYPQSYGAHLAQMKQYDRAIEQFREAIRRQPEYAQAHLSLALALFERGDLSGSSRVAVGLLRMKPDSQAARELLRKIDAAERLL